MQEPCGLWLIGAGGSVATTVSLGLHSLANGYAEPIGLVSELPEFSGTDLLGWDRVVIGGHEIRQVDCRQEAAKLAHSTRAFELDLVERNAEWLDRVTRNIRPGILAHAGSTITAMASDHFAALLGSPPLADAAPAPDARGRQRSTEPPRETHRETHSYRSLIEQVRSDLVAFAERHGLSNVIVVNVASTEPPVDLSGLPTRWDELESQLDEDKASLSSSMLYAIASFLAGFPFINFTPSVGSNCPALKELAERQGVAHAGQDGKTGETLVKSALAPMFAYRHLQVMSWVGHNIFGNLDAKILDDPENKRSKVESKDRLLTKILGYAPQTHVSIENIDSLGDWKTAWDHVHFRGFLGTPMVMQFIWQGCDSMLAAPLVLDLFRFTERAARNGESGVLAFLSSFFKSPMQAEDDRPHPQDLSLQFQELLAWNRRLK